MNPLVYSKSAITNNIIPHYADPIANLNDITYLFGLFCFTSLILWRYIESVLSEDNKPFPLKVILGQLTLAIILWGTFQALLPTIISVTNYIADLIFSETQLAKLATRYFTTDDFKEWNFSVWSLNFNNLIGSFAWILGNLAFYIVGYVRFFILSVLYIFFPFAIALSLIPMFGFNYLIKYLTLFIQVASWAIFQSILNLILSTMPLDTFPIGSIEYITILIIYVVCAIFIPMIASNIIGGGDLSPISGISLLLAKKVAKENPASKFVSKQSKGLWEIGKNYTKGKLMDASKALFR